MAHKFEHFCPVARSLEKIGEKWSLLIVRDLLRGPQRFTDLLNSLNSITPAWLTQRLRTMEAAGIIDRDIKSGRREVWYRLTSAGRDLEPVVEALVAWGLRYAMRPPLPGEFINPESLMTGLTWSLNKRSKSLPQPTRWSIHFPQAVYTVSFDNDHWSQCKGEEPNADLHITARPEIWATMTTVSRKERSLFVKEMQIQGKPERLEEFLQIFSVENHENLSSGKNTIDSGEYKKDIP